MSAGKCGSGTSRWNYVLLGAAVGFGVACKISMFVLAGFAVLGASLALYRVFERDRVIDAAGQLTIRLRPVRMKIASQRKRIGVEDASRTPHRSLQTVQRK